MALFALTVLTIALPCPAVRPQTLLTVCCSGRIWGSFSVLELGGTMGDVTAACYEHVYRDAAR